MGGKKYWTVLLFLGCMLSVWAQSHPVEAALSDYEHTLKTLDANRFFTLLDKEEFTENKIQFTVQVPADSVRQQVLY